jgi:hypothetical protein
MMPCRSATRAIVVLSPPVCVCERDVCGLWRVCEVVGGSVWKEMGDEVCYYRGMGGA